MIYAHTKSCAPAPQRGIGIVARIVSADAIWRQRRALAALDAGRLDDLGIGPAAATEEAARPVWDVPGHWRR